MNPKRGITVLLGNLAGLISLSGPRFYQLLSEKARTLIENFVRQRECGHYRNIKTQWGFCLPFSMCLQLVI